MGLNNEQMVWNFANRLRAVIPFYGFSSHAIELIFMKYMSQFGDVYLPEQFKTLMAYKDMFIAKTFEPGLVADTFRIAEEVYGIENSLLVRTVDDLYKLFGDKPDYIFEVLNEFELPKTNEERIELLEVILEYSENKDVSRNGVASTNTSLIKLVSEILDVKQDETYMDCFAGFSKSSFRINAANYLGYEINSEVAAVSNMLMILTGKKRFEVKNQNYYLSESHSVADKVFSDGPLGITLTPDEYHMLGGESKKGDYYSLKNAVDSLKPNGIAAVTCASGVLIKIDFCKLRELLTFRNLKAVIALPALWNFTSIPTNLVIFEKERKSNDVIMIDASASDCFTKVDKRTIALTDETIEKIINSLNGEIIDGFSTSVPAEKILKGETDFSWVPSHYIERKMNIEFRPSSEIKSELSEAYEELYRLLKK